MAKLAPNGKFFLCPGCERYELTEADFYKDRSKKYGLSRLCKRCESGRTAKAKHDWYMRSAKKKMINNRATKRKYYLAKREEIQAKNRAYKTTSEYREKRRMFNFKWKYHLTKEQRDAMIGQQQGMCEICGEFYGEDLQVDHDHRTGRVRAMLCSTCNKGLGMFKDDPELLAIACSYLYYYRDDL